MLSAQHFWLGSWTLCERELVRFLRQRSRVIGAFLPPVVFWLLIGSGLAHSFRGANYLQYFFPGTIVLIILFTAIFSTISIIEDRHAGFLQSALVAPLSRMTIVTGKIGGAALLALIHALPFLFLAPLAGLSVPVFKWIPVLLLLSALSVGQAGLGFLIAWRLDSSQGFHAIMNLFLIPMWLLSGALFPPSGAARWIRIVMHLNPLTYGVLGLQECFFADGVPMGHSPVSFGVCLAISTGFAALTIIASIWSARKTA
jgi:ABC-2 type transport system permease protein